MSLEMSQWFYKWCVFSYNMGLLFTVPKQLLRQLCHYHIHTSAFLNDGFNTAFNNVVLLWTHIESYMIWIFFHRFSVKISLEMSRWFYKCYVFSSNMGLLLTVEQQLHHKLCHYHIHALAFVCWCRVSFFIFMELPQMYLPLK